MEQCFRVALWMSLLIGYLHAHPVNSCFMNMNDLGFELLRNVSCENLNFTSPVIEQVNEKCRTAGLKIFKEGLELARNNCEGLELARNCSKKDRFHIGQTLEALDLDCLPEINPSCNFTMTVHENFGSFLKALQSFAEQFNNSQAKG